MSSYPLDPLFDENSEILILGSYPGEKSKLDGFYYVDNRNQFWNLISEAFNEPIPNSDSGKERFLKKHHIALWDVCKECGRTGSSDKDLKLLERNDLNTVLPPYSKIKTILCNGSRSYKLFKETDRSFDIRYEKLISSSGAANKYSEKRIKQWVKLLSD